MNGERKKLKACGDSIMTQDDAFVCRISKRDLEWMMMFDDLSVYNQQTLAISRKKEKIAADRHKQWREGLASDIVNAYNDKYFPTGEHTDE